MIFGKHRLLWLLCIAAFICSGFIPLIGFAAWISLSLVLTIVYEVVLITQENLQIVAEAITEKLDKIGQQCTRMSTQLREIDETLEKIKKL